jgi:hypothetical protein
MEIGGEFMVRSYSRGNAMYVANDYVTVEVALYALKDQSVEIGYLDFELRINGKKQTLMAQQSLHRGRIGRSSGMAVAETGRRGDRRQRARHPRRTAAHAFADRRSAGQHRPNHAASS